MSNDTVVSLAAPSRDCDPLTELSRVGARRLIEAAVSAKFWAARSEVFPTTRTQSFWMNKAGNVLNYLPRSGQAKADQAMHGIWMAATRAKADGCS